MSVTIVKRVKVGDLIDSGRYGQATITRVYGYGERVDLTDRLGREWTVERAPEGYWTRLDA